MLLPYGRTVSSTASANTSGSTIEIVFSPTTLPLYNICTVASPLVPLDVNTPSTTVPKLESVSCHEIPSAGTSAGEPAASTPLIVIVAFVPGA